MFVYLVVTDGEFNEVTCPRCDGEFVTDVGWRGRCPLCRLPSQVPGDPAVIYDGSDTVKTTMGQAQELVNVSVVAYSPDDGPNGITFRPLHGLGISNVQERLDRLAG